MSIDRRSLLKRTGASFRVDGVGARTGCRSNGRFRSASRYRAAGKFRKGRLYAAHRDRTGRTVA